MDARFILIFTSLVNDAFVKSTRLAELIIRLCSSRIIGRLFNLTKFGRKEHLKRVSRYRPDQNSYS